MASSSLGSPTDDSVDVDDVTMPHTIALMSSSDESSLAGSVSPEVPCASSVSSSSAAAVASAAAAPWSSVSHPLYRDGLVTLTDGELVIHNYYFPFGQRKTVPLQKIRSIRLRKLDALSGRFMLWGPGFGGRWYHNDCQRPTKRFAVDVSTGSLMEMAITPKNPRKLFELLCEHCSGADWRDLTLVNPRLEKMKKQQQEERERAQKRALKEARRHTKMTEKKGSREADLPDLTFRLEGDETDVVLMEDARERSPGAASSSSSVRRRPLGTK